MSHVEGFPDRDGIDRLVKLGKAMCTLVTTFAPLLYRKYPDNPTITGLITAIMAVCALLPEVEAEFLGEGGDNADPLDDPENIPGTNPGLPPAPDPTT